MDGSLVGTGDGTIEYAEADSALHAVASGHPLTMPDALQEVWILELGSLSLIGFPATAKKAIDLGCGTGIWARTMATQYPGTAFIAVDVNPPVEGTLSTSAAGNCHFVKANVEDEWTFVDSPGTVDYILARLLTTGIRNWERLYSQAFSAITPGGYFESQETLIALLSDDDEKYRNTPAMKWFRCLGDFAMGNGVETGSIYLHDKRLEGAGFKVIAEKTINKFLDPSRPEMQGRERVGELEIKQMNDLIDGTTPRIFAGSSSISLEEGQRMAAEAKADMKENSGKCGYHTRNRVVVAQKPN